MKSFQIKTRVNFGDNALDRLAEVPYKKILIVTDPFMAKSKNLNLILDPIKKAGKEYDIFQDIVPLVSLNPFLTPAELNGWHGKPARRTSKSGMSTTSI